MIFLKAIFILGVSLLALTEAAVIPQTPKKKVIIDCDPGGDDAAALILLLRKPEKIDILALTITFGNSYLNQTAKNALRVLKLTDRLNIPIYLGSPHSVSNSNMSFDHFFGMDGFGDFADDTVIDYTPYLIRTENATQAMRRLVRENPNEITLLAVGPLTNLAYALKSDPDFGTKFQETVIMGGTYKGVGNIKPRVEFNFYFDPEAANDVMTKWKGKILLVTWELCISAGLPWEWYDTKIVGQQNKYSVFLKHVGVITQQNTAKQNISSFVPCDQLAAATLISRSIIKTSQLIDCRVELVDPERRGENIVNWNSTKTDKNIWLVTEVNLELAKKVLADGTAN